MDVVNFAAECGSDSGGVVNLTRPEEFEIHIGAYERTGVDYAAALTDDGAVVGRTGSRDFATAALSHAQTVGCNGVGLDFP